MESTACASSAAEAPTGRRFSLEAPPEFSMVDDLIFHDVAAALALPFGGEAGGHSQHQTQNQTQPGPPPGADDAFVASLLRLDDDVPASADDLEVALLAGEMLLDASRSGDHDRDHVNMMDLYASDAFDDDAATDVASEAASPPPGSTSPCPSPASPTPVSAGYNASCQPYSPPRAVASRVPLLPAPSRPSIASPAQKMEPPVVESAPFPANALPYALPIAYFAPATLNANQKRPLAGGKGHAGADADASDDHSAKKSKREIRQMKNRESANKSRLRRKAQLGELTAEVAELKHKEQALQMVIAGLRAENKSLQSQNSFLQSLVTSVKRDAQPQAQLKHLAVYDQHPSAPAHANFIALPVMDAQDSSCSEDADECQALDTRATKRKRSLASLTTASAATLTMCASVFGITLLADVDGGYAAAGHVRQSGRVLHEVAPQTSAAVGAGGCSPEHGPLSLAMVWAKLLAAWELVTASDLVYGVLLNVLSFVVIMAVYHWWQSSSSTAKSHRHRSHRHGQCGRQSRFRHRLCGHDDGKQRSASWHPAGPLDDDSDEECPR